MPLLELRGERNLRGIAVGNAKPGERGWPLGRPGVGNQVDSAPIAERGYRRVCDISHGRMHIQQCREEAARLGQERIGNDGALGFGDIRPDGSDPAVAAGVGADRQPVVVVHLCLERHGDALGHRPAHLALDDRAAGRGEELPHIDALELRGGNTQLPEVLLRALVDEGDAPVGVVGDECVGDAFDNVAEGAARGVGIIHRFLQPCVGLLELLGQRLGLFELLLQLRGQRVRLAGLLLQLLRSLLQLPRERLGLRSRCLGRVERIADAGGHTSHSVAQTRHFVRVVGHDCGLAGSGDTLGHGGE